MREMALVGRNARCSLSRRIIRGGSVAYKLGLADPLCRIASSNMAEQLIVADSIAQQHAPCDLRDMAVQEGPFDIGANFNRSTPEGDDRDRDVGKQLCHGSKPIWPTDSTEVIRATPQLNIGIGRTRFRPDWFS